MSSKMKITVLSGACCNPQLAVQDQQYMSRIKEALNKNSIEAQLEVVSATEAIYSGKTSYIRKLRPLFNKYGWSVAPALFINEELVFYGVVPPVEKLSEAILKAAQGPIEKSEEQQV